MKECNIRVVCTVRTLIVSKESPIVFFSVCAERMRGEVDYILREDVTAGNLPLFQASASAYDCFAFIGA